METSCLNNSNVADAFETLIEITHIELMKRLQNSSMQMIKKRFKINKNNNGNTRHCCKS